PEHVDELKSFNLLGIAAGGGKDEDRLAEVAPAGHGDLGPEPLREPAGLDEIVAHGQPAARHCWMRFQNSSVNFSTSCGGNSAANLRRTASFASGEVKNSDVASSR